MGLPYQQSLWFMDTKIDCLSFKNMSGLHAPIFQNPLLLEFFPFLLPRWDRNFLMPFRLPTGSFETCLQTFFS